MQLRLEVETLALILQNLDLGLNFFKEDLDHLGELIFANFIAQFPHPVPVDHVQPIALLASDCRIEGLTNCQCPRGKPDNFSIQSVLKFVGVFPMKNGVLRLYVSWKSSAAPVGTHRLPSYSQGAGR